MTNLSTYNQFYFIGIGGIGMSALARYFNACGYRVEGYDKTPSTLTEELIKEGISVHYEDDIKRASFEITHPEHQMKTLVVYTPAVPKDHSELNFFLNNGYTVKKRAEVLAALTNGKTTIAVAGTHGKTSTAAIISHILYVSKIPFYGFLGGIAANFNNNFIAPKSGDADLIVVEADEFDRSFHQLNPDFAIVTAVEPDHLDIYGTFDELKKAYTTFAEKVKPGGKLIIEEKAHISPSGKMLQFKYGMGPNCDIRAENIRIEKGAYVFDAVIEDAVLPGLSLGIPGRHNIENSLAAIAATLPYITDVKNLYEALETFKGVRRRFELILKNEDVVFVDDYAHHPTEIKVTVETVKELYPNKKILGIFQPHLFSRTNDFAQEFAESLSLLNEVILLPIYPAREKPMPGVTSQLILNHISTHEKMLMDKAELLQYLADTDAEVILTIGAGDIDRLVEPIKEILLNKTLA